MEITKITPEDVMSSEEVQAAINGLLALRRYLANRERLVGFEAEIAGFRVTSLKDPAVKVHRDLV